MSSVTDVLHLEPQDLGVFIEVFPRCTFLPGPSGPARYRVVIPDMTDEEYYLFLVDNCLALCSANFLGRVENDELFARRMRHRQAKSMKALQARASAGNPPVTAGSFEARVTGPVLPPPP